MRVHRKSAGGYVDFEWLVMAGLIALLVALVIVIVVASAHEAQRWEAFKLAHSCKIVARMNGELVTGVGSSSGGGTVVTIGSTSDQLGWLCDDGVTYWRDK